MYVNGNAYAEPITERVCDDCLRPDEFDSYTYPDGHVHLMQRKPWHWWPDAASGGYTCIRCGVVVVRPDGR